MNEVAVKGDFIKLEALLKFSGLCDTGGMAKTVVRDGEVKVNGEVCLQRGRKLRAGDEVEFAGTKLRVAAEP
ncbi:MAG TPA: RNA-binding S4 domain-containing protein [Oscillospiraceae bacterium]|nr:RNA-binding S4 domain-containing protein [Oscillospiraceae bacterium]